MSRFQVKVIPRASRNEVIQLSSSQLKVKLTAPPVEGKANQILIELLAKYFRLPKRSIRILKGENSQNKMIEIDPPLCVEASHAK